MINAMPAPLLTLLLACGGPNKADEVGLYSATVARAGQDPAAEMQTCLGLRDPELRGDCAGVVAITAARAGEDAATWCGQVPEGRWRSECQFQASEAAVQAHDTQDAAGLCDQAGAFQADCLMHLWQLPLTRMVEGMGRDAFAARYAGADRLFEQARAAPGVPADLERRFWLSFFQTGFANSGGVDLSACAALPAQGQQRCETAGALLLTEGLEAALRRDGRLEAFCAAQGPSSADVAGLLGTEPSPALDQAVAEQQGAICGAGRRPMIMGGRRLR